MKMKCVMFGGLAAVLCGCISGQTIVALNGSSNDMHSVRITSTGGFGFTYGVLPLGISKGCSGLVSIGSRDQCEVSWYDNQRSNHVVKLDMSKQLTRPYLGDICFTITDDGTVKVETKLP